jgi:serine/threonine-protein kinase
MAVRVDLRFAVSARCGGVALRALFVVVLLRCSSAQMLVRTLAGSGAGSFADGINATFNYPAGVAVDAVGNVFVADQNNQRIRKVTPGGVVSTLAGSGARSFADGTGTSAAFNNPWGMAIDASGILYVADGGNQRIRKVTPGGVASTLAGGGTGSFADSPAAFYNPKGVAVDSNGTVFVGDDVNGCVRKVTPGGVVRTLAGGLTNPYGVALDASSNV